MVMMGRVDGKALFQREGPRLKDFQGSPSNVTLEPSA